MRCTGSASVIINLQYYHQWMLRSTLFTYCGSYGSRVCTGSNMLLILLLNDFGYGLVVALAWMHILQSVVWLQLFTFMPLVKLFFTISFFYSYAIDSVVLCDDRESSRHSLFLLCCKRGLLWHFLTALIHIDYFSFLLLNKFSCYMVAWIFLFHRLTCNRFVLLC